MMVNSVFVHPTSQQITVLKKHDEIRRDILRWLLRFSKKYIKLNGQDPSKDLLKLQVEECIKSHYRRNNKWYNIVPALKSGTLYEYTQKWELREFGGENGVKSLLKDDRIFVTYSYLKGFTPSHIKIYELGDLAYDYHYLLDLRRNRRVTVFGRDGDTWQILNHKPPNPIVDYSIPNLRSVVEGVLLTMIRDMKRHRLTAGLLDHEELVLFIKEVFKEHIKEYIRVYMRMNCRSVVDVIEHVLRDDQAEIEKQIKKNNRINRIKKVV